MNHIPTAEVEAVMKRCQRGTTNYHEHNNLHAECYGTLGALSDERDRLALALRHVIEQADRLAGGRLDGKLMDRARILANPPETEALHRNGSSG